jgi:hypothetical protein
VGGDNVPAVQEAVDELPEDGVEVDDVEEEPDVDEPEESDEDVEDVEELSFFDPPSADADSVAGLDPLLDEARESVL